MSRLLFILIFMWASTTFAAVPTNILKQKESVVTVFIVKEGKTIASGSGFSVQPSGNIITNYHVIEGYFKASGISIVVKSEDGRLANASEIVSFDEKHDIAKIKLVDSTLLPQLSMALSSPKQGEDVYVIGSPMGLETTISTGIVSSIRGEDKFIQITAPISSGSSGSPVLNSKGEVVGIATLILQGGQNLNFAIPIKYLEQLDKKKNLNIKITNIPSNSTEVKNNSDYRKDIHQFRKAIVDLVFVDKSNIYLRYILDEDKIWLCAPFSIVEIGDVIEFPITQIIKDQIDESSGRFFSLIAYIPSFSVTTRQNKVLTVDEELSIADRYRDAFFYKIALDLYDKVLSSDHYHQAYFGKSVCYKNLIDWNNAEKNKDACEEAMANINKAISMNKDSDYFAHRGDLYNSNSYCPSIYNIDLSIADYSTAISIKPKPQHYNSRAEIYRERKEYDKALADINKSMAIEQDISSLNIRGNIYSDMGDINKAIIDYKKSIDKAYKSKFDWDRFIAPTTNLKDLYISKMNFKDGIIYFSKLIQENNKVSILYMNRGELYGSDKQFKKAIADYTSAINNSPSYATPYSSRALLYMELDKPDLAHYDFEKACELGSDKTSYECSMNILLLDSKKRGFNWKHITSGANTTFYYDKSLVKKLNKNGIKTWIRSEESDLDALKAKRSYNGLDYDKYSHTMQEWQFDCGNNKVANLQTIDYESSGSIIYQANFKTNLESVIPNTIGESILKSICHTPLENAKSSKHKSK